METISPWTIYWVLQLDNIGNASEMVAFLGLFALPFLWGFVLSELKSLAAFVFAVGVTVVWLAVATAAIFLPSTKTAAAMFVIPAIANNETIQREAGDLYGLAKQALVRAGAPEPKAPDKEAE